MLALATKQQDEEVAANKSGKTSPSSSSCPLFLNTRRIGNEMAKKKKTMII